MEQPRRPILIPTATRTLNLKRLGSVKCFSLFPVPHKSHHIQRKYCRACLKCDGTRAETRVRLSPQRTSPFKSARESVQSTAGSRGVRISVSNAVYTTFQGSVRVLLTPFASFPFTSPPVRHHVPSGFKRAIPQYISSL